MSDPLHDVFEILEPPPGGLRELRRRVHGERVPRWTLFGGAALAAAAASLLLVVTPPAHEPGADLAAAMACSDPALASVLCGQRDTLVAVAPGHHDRLAITPVPTSSDSVLFYRVAATNAPLSGEQVRRLDLRGK